VAAAEVAAVAAVAAAPRTLHTTRRCFRHSTCVSLPNCWGEL